MTRFPAITASLCLLTAIAAAALLGAAPQDAAQDGASAAPVAPESEQVKLDIKEWPVEWQRTRPRDPYVAPDGSVWFVGQTGDYLGRLDPTTGEMKRFELSEGAGPHTVIVDRDGYPWYAGNRDRHIGRLDPATGDIKRYDMPDGVEDPHTMAWTSDGKIWFTAQRSPPARRIGLFDPQTGETQVIEVPGRGMRPYGLIVDATDRPWIAFMGDNAIGTVDPETMELQIIQTPDEASRIRRLSATSDGRIWWVDAAAGWMGVYDPELGQMRQWQSPAGRGADLYATAVDSSDRFWYVESGVRPNRIIGFDTKQEKVISINEIPSGGGSVRHMVYHPTTNAIWFGTDAHTIGRAMVP